jgi:chitin synthase
MQKIFSSFGSSGGDATQFLEQVKKAEGKDRWTAYMRCLDGLMYTGVIDTRDSPQCRFSNYMMLVATIILVMIIGVKFLAALQCSPRREPEEHDKFVICAVPCYTEGIDSLQKTMDSLAASRYDEKRKLMFIIADGIVTGGGNDAPTPELLLKVLGWEGPEPEPQAFQSLGEGMKQLNFGKVYSGLYALEGRYTPYVVVIKTGNDTETHKAGNRWVYLTCLFAIEHSNQSNCKAENETRK